MIEYSKPEILGVSWWEGQDICIGRPRDALLGRAQTRKQQSIQLLLFPPMRPSRQPGPRNVNFLNLGGQAASEPLLESATLLCSSLLPPMGSVSWTLLLTKTKETSLEQFLSISLNRSSPTPPRRLPSPFARSLLEPGSLSLLMR